MTSLNGYSKLERQQGTQPEVRHFGHKHFKEDGNRQFILLLLNMQIYMVSASEQNASRNIG